MDIAAALRKAAVVKRGRVRLTSGKISDFYIDLKSAYADPLLLRRLGREMRKLLPKHVDAIAVTGYGGLPLGTAVSLAARVPLTMIREKPKRHGRGGWIDGHVPSLRERVALIDDVSTTGKSMRRMEKIVRQGGAHIVARLVVVNRAPRPIPGVRMLVHVDELTRSFYANGVGGAARG